MAREQDVQLGKLALERGLITELQLRECLDVLSAKLETSENPSSDSLNLVTIMLDKGYVQPGEITELLRIRSSSTPQPPPPPPDAQNVSDVPSEVLQAQQFAESHCGKYVIVKLLGSGGMGAVYRAWDTQLRRFVAIKFLTLGTEENIRRFIREAQTAARLNHSNIAQIYDFGAADGRHYIAMEYIEGVTLDTLPESIRKTDLPKIVRILRDVAGAVEYAHSKGVIHRDLKPQNVMIDEDLVPHVMDFGLARAVAVPGLQARAQAAVGRREITVSGTIVGTPNYVPPEQARGDIDRIDARSDVYSLGATLYALVTGRPPFAEASPMETLMAVLQQEPPAPRALNPAVPRDLETVVLKAISKEPFERYASAREFGEDLTRVLNGEPVLARRAGALARLRAAILRRPTLSTAVASIAIIAGFASALIYQTHRANTDYEKYLQEQAAREEARKRAEERRQRAAPHVDAARRQLEQAERLLVQPDFRPAELEGLANEAIKALNEAINADDSYIDAYALRAKAYELLRMPTAALNDLSQAIARSDGGAVTFERGRLQLLAALASVRAPVLLLPTVPSRGLKEPASAHSLRRAATDDLLRVKPAIAEDRLRTEGYLRLAQGRWSDALSSLGALPPKDAEGRYLVARLLFDRRQFEDADVNLADALRARPNYADALLLRAAICLRLDRLTQAEAAIHQAAAIAPSLPSVHILRGNLRAAQGTPERAAEEYDAALKLDSNDPIALINRAVVLTPREPESALRSLGLAVQLQSEAFELALALRAPLVRDTANGEMDAERATKENPDYAPAWRALADMRRRRGNLPGAEEAATRADELEKRP